MVTPSPLLPGLWQKRKQYQAALTAQIAAKVEMLGAANAAAAPVETYEAYEQEMNAIYLSTLAIGNTQLSDYQRERVELVADLCPFEGGFATYKARGIYGTMYRHFRPEWFACAEEIKPREGLEKEKKAGPETMDFRLLPNPATDQFYVVCSKPIANGMVLRFWTTTGKLLQQQQLTEQTSLLRAENLPTGIYLVELMDELGFRTVHKLQIIR